MVIWKNKFAIILYILPIIISANNEELLKKIINKYDVISFSTNFEQINFWEDLEIEKISKGQMLYNHEKLILNYSIPQGQQLLLEGEDLSIYDRENNQLIKTKVNDAISKIKPIEIIKQYWDISKKTVSKFGEKTKVTLEPINNEIIMIEIILIDNHIKKLSYNNVEKNSVSFSFSNEKFNHEIKPNTFELKLDENVSIIEN